MLPKKKKKLFVKSGMTNFFRYLREARTPRNFIILDNCTLFDVQVIPGHAWIVTRD